MKKHQLSSMISGFSLLIVVSLIVPVYAGEDSEKSLCKKNGGEWEGDVCDFKTDDEDKADRFMEESEKVREFQEERAAEEDALCDDEDAETTNIEMCSSDLTLGQAFAEKYNKENCEDNNGEWIEGECDFYENQMKEGWEVDEDNFYQEVCNGDYSKEEDDDRCEKHRLSIKDGE